MYYTDKMNDEFYVFQLDDETVTVDGFYGVDIGWGEPLRDGAFYKVIADVTYLNGGIGGYVNYPEIKSVSSYEEVSPFDIGLPTIEEKAYGLLLIGDYGDGDILLREYRTRAVWKDGHWAYRYDEEVDFGTDQVAFVRKGVSVADVEAGVERGVLSCADYFVMPPEAES